MKQMPSPTAAMSSPATAGPTNRAPLTSDELSAIAFGRSSRFSIMSIRNDCLIGMSKAFTTLMKSERATMCHTATACERTKMPITSAWSIASDWVAISRRCLLNRSATTPPTGDRTNDPIWEQKPTRPSRNAERVRV